MENREKKLIPSVEVAKYNLKERYTTFDICPNKANKYLNIGTKLLSDNSVKREMKQI